MAERRGETGQNVNRLKGNPNSQRTGDFYANGSNQTKDDDEPVRGVTSEHSGAKRESYFRKRDYYCRLCRLECWDVGMLGREKDLRICLTSQHPNIPTSQPGGRQVKLAYRSE